MTRVFTEARSIATDLNPLMNMVMDVQPFNGRQLSRCPLRNDFLARVVVLCICLGETMSCVCWVIVLKVLDIDGLDLLVMLVFTMFLMCDRLNRSVIMVLMYFPVDSSGDVL